MTSKPFINRLILLLGLISIPSFGQQDAQYTQYMYNTMSINAAYAGQREVLSIVGLHRSQWVGIDGAPQTQTLGIHSPLRNERIGIGLSIINDQLGPARETYASGSFSYSILLNSYDTKLSLGINAGFHLLKTDWSKGKYQNPDIAFNENLNLFSPIIGAGLYLHSRKWYAGISVPNLITTKHYSDFQESLATESLHFFLIGGYVLDLTENTKFKPSFLIKAVFGSPVIADLSANFLLYDKLTLGVAWRWDDSISALAGFQVTKNLYIGYAYDLTTTGLKNYNSGSHEIMLRFELLQKNKRLLSPRFF
ncbi:hypothetical protein AB832_02380 [Flavobacteriaceae bacterium (ex Bugula neritina AB1)]|nr:hypothetical protein AB832_02380 [Flavobacteriaceae bacterium (ex Bugula neritina AB1)]